MARNQDTGLIIVLTAVMGIGPLVNYGLSTTSSLIISDFGITAGQFGLLATVCFSSAALSSFSLGRLSDRIPAAAQLGLIFGGTAAGLMAIALAPSYGWLLAAMVIAGPAQALSNPMTNRVIMQRVAADKRAGWIGVKQSGVQASQLFAGLFFPSVALLAGWHGAAAAAAGVALALMLWSWNRVQVRPATRPTVEAATGAKPEHAAGLPAAVWILTGYSLFCGAGLQATNVYLPLFAHREIGVGLLLAGLTAVLSGIVGVSSRVFWGRQMNTGARTSLLLALLAAGALLGTTFLLTSGAYDAQPLMWLGIVLHGATALGGNVVVMAGLMHTVPASRVGAASGIVALGLYSGFALGPLMMGILLGRSGNFFGGWIMASACYVLCIALALTLAGSRQGRAGSPAPSAGRTDSAAVQPQARCGE